MAAVEGIGRASDYVGNATHDLYRKYGKQIYAYCLHKLRSKEEAEDAVQTTFMNAFRSLQRGNTAEYEQAWLFKIAQNVCHARASSSSRRLKLEAPNDFEVLQEIVPAKDGGDDSLELIGFEEALERMPENQRRAILLREWQGLSYKEIAAELGVTQTAVEMLIFRARRSLAGALEQPVEKTGRVARLAGAFGSLIGALKTVLTGGAAIKAATVAAAAVAVVGEGASHTIVKRDAPAHKPAPVVAVAAAAPAQKHATPAVHVAAVGDAAAVVKRAAARVARATTTHAPVRAAHRASPAQHATPAPEPVSPTVVAPPPVAQPEPTPAPTPAPAPAPTPTPAAPPETKGSDKPKEKEKEKEKPAPPIAPIVAVTPPAVETPVETSGPGNGNGHGKKKDKDRGGKLQEPPVEIAPPVVAEPAVTTPVVTQPVVAEPVVSAPAVEPQSNGNGNGNAYGKKNRKP